MNIGVGLKKKGKNIHVDIFDSGFACIKSISFEFYSSYSQFILCGIEFAIVISMCIRIYPLNTLQCLFLQHAFIELDVDMP